MFLVRHQYSPLEPMWVEIIIAMKLYSMLM